MKALAKNASLTLHVDERNTHTHTHETSQGASSEATPLEKLKPLLNIKLPKVKPLYINGQRVYLVCVHAHQQ